MNSNGPPSDSLFAMPPEDITPEPVKRKYHDAVLRWVEAGPEAGDAERREASAMVSEVVHDYLGAIGTGAEFHAADFTNWLERERLLPPRNVWDARGVGAVIVRLEKEGRIEFVRFCPNGGSAGSKTRKYNSLSRPLYRVASSKRSGT